MLKGALRRQGGVFLQAEGTKEGNVSRQRSKWLQNLIHFVFILHQASTQGVHPSIPTVQQKVLDFSGCYKTSVRSENKLFYLYTELQHRPVIVYQWYQR